MDPERTRLASSTPINPDEKTCLFCAEIIKAGAKKCKRCGEFLLNASNGSPSS